MEAAVRIYSKKEMFFPKKDISEDESSHPRIF